MPTDLSDLELDEVSLVGKAANGKRFLIYKSMQGGNKMRQTKPAGATTTGASAARVSKADILGIVQKAIAPLQEENAILRKSLEQQQDILRTKEYVEIAKSAFSELGKPEETAEILKSLESLPSEARKKIIATMKQANVMKAEAGKMLYQSIGTSRPAPGSSTAQFEELVSKRVSEIQKSATGSTNPKVLRAQAVTAITRENPALARAVVAEEREATMRQQMGLIAGVQ